MKVIIGSGKVANVLKNKNDEIISHKEIEITDKKSVNSKLCKFPTGTTIINAAAKINLEWCEENKDEARLVNTVGATIVAESCEKFNHHLVHISSGCIFDGMETEKIYHENDEPTPASWYAQTKADADKLIMSLYHEKITIIRPRQLISAIPNKTNMLTKFASMKKGYFIDSKNSITCIEDMKDAIEHIISKKLYGIFNVANPGYSSPHKIATKIKNSISPDLVVEKISYHDYISNLSVKRVNTLLNIDKLVSTGHVPRNADDAIDWCLKHYEKVV